MSLNNSMCVFLWGKISQKFDLKNMNSTHTKDFPWKQKWPKFAKQKVSKLPDFYDKFQ
jgi:hypothetical protein